ncbi:MAG: pilus assembly protein TadG-related protein [Chloroflexota bacterium]
MNTVGLRRQITSPGRAPERERGQILVIFALSLVALLASAGLVIDLGGAWGQARSEQKVADVAALAAATAEGNGVTRAQIVQAAIDSAVANGFIASEVQVNMPPTTGKYAPGGSQSGPLSTNDCSTAALRPCWIEVVINRPHVNSFSRVVGIDTFGVTSRGVAVGGVANAVSNGIAPLMFNYKSIKGNGTTPSPYCDPQPGKCDPNSSWPTLNGQFSWTTFCVTGGNCNVNSADAKGIIQGGNFQIEVYLGMYLGPHNNGQKTAVCNDLVNQYPNGADLPVSVNDDNGNLVGFWVWHLDTANSDCNGNGGEQLYGWFVNDLTSTLPLSISAGGSAATFGEQIVRLVE